MKLTIETSQQRFLDTDIAHNNNMIETQAHRKKTKLPRSWISNIPKRYKQYQLSKIILSKEKKSPKLTFLSLDILPEDFYEIELYERTA